jgi:GNAT superfamily N-acetyltransferase
VIDAVELREARVDDGEFLLALAREAYQEVLSLQFAGWNEAVHGQRFAEKIASLPFWIAELNGEPVATVSSTLCADHLRLNELIVLPTFQGRGIGSRLLLREIERARAAGVPVRLHTFRLNRAAKFYEQHGFRRTGQDDDYIDFEHPQLIYPHLPLKHSPCETHTPLSSQEEPGPLHIVLSALEGARHVNPSLQSSLSEQGDPVLPSTQMPSASSGLSPHKLLAQAVSLKHNEPSSPVTQLPTLASASQEQ